MKTERLAIALTIINLGYYQSGLTVFVFAQT
jgi:hypothetical protein